MNRDFTATRRSVLTVAIVGGVATFLALILLEAYRDSLWPWLYSAATNILGVLFGLAVVSMIWEFFVRRDHSSDLRHYLRLGASVAKSGLQDVAPRSKLDWQDLLESANEVTVLTHSAEWLERNAYLLLDVARTRPLAVTVAVPVKGGAFLEQEATRLGKTANSLFEAIQQGVTSSVRMWRDAKGSTQTLHKNSTIRVVEHEFDLDYEVIMIDHTTVVTFAAPGNVGPALDRVAFVYSQSIAEYPTSFFASYRAQLDTMNGLDEA